uniref:Uncharacterized protein n=1 Tax=Arundo donax TaxID=35708 RepID=A0A0A8Z8J4_ARUDO
MHIFKHVQSGITAQQHMTLRWWPE